MDARLPIRSARYFGVGLLLALFPGQATAQWSIAMRAMRNPLPVGECTYVEIVVKDAQGRQGPPRPDGKQVSGWDFDFTIISSAPDAFQLQNEDATRPFICARAPTAPTATFVAHYPGRQLKPNQIVPGVEVRQSVEVAMSASPQTDPAAGGVGAVSAYAGAGAEPGYPSGYGPGASVPAPGYPPGYSNADPGGYTQPVGYPQAAATQAQPVAGTTPAPETPGVRTGKQFIDRITSHVKRKASEVASNTTTHVAEAAGAVVGTTLEAGGGVVRSGTGAVSGVASKGVQGVGSSLAAESSLKDPADVPAALAAGRAVLYGLRFTEGTAILEPSSGPLIGQIAGALARLSGQFLIEAHVEGKDATPAQALSEQRAAAVKAALVAAGTSPMQLAAVGYGATRPMAGARVSARIEIARTH